MERMRFEEPRRPRIEPRVERRQNPELARMKAAIERVIAVRIGDPGLPPTTGERLRQLEMILEAEPQRDARGALRYLVTSGLAVEMVTGFERPHHDIDLVIMDPENRNYWDLIGTDNVTPGQYWANMKFDPEFLEASAREAKTRKRGKSPVAEVVHPGVVMVQKASDAFGRPPRKKDQDDVEAIVRHWRERESYTRDWNPIVRGSLDALPRNELDRTLKRLRRAIG